MKRSKIRKKIKTGSFYFLLSIAVFFTFDVYSGTAPRMLFEKKFNSFFSENLTIDIGHLEGGIFKDVVSTDLTISHPGLKKPLKLERVEFAYRFWYPLINKIKKSFFLKRTGKMKIFFKDRNSFVNGYLALDGSFENLSILAYFSFKGEKEKHVLKGRILRVKESLYTLNLMLDEDINAEGVANFKDLLELSLDIAKGKQEILLNISKIEKDKFILRTGLKHLDIKGVDITGNITSLIKLNEDMINLEMAFRNMKINQMPFKNIDIKGQFINKRNLIDIHAIRLGNMEDMNTIHGSAIIGLYEKTYLKLSLFIKDLLLEEFALSRYDEKIASGLTNGEIKIKGPIDNLSSKIHIDVQNGKIMDLDFQSLIATLEGTGKRLEVDGCIIKESGRLMLSGEIDFGLIPSDKAFANFKMDTGKNMAIWDGWEIFKQLKTSKIEAKKKLAKDVIFYFEAHSGENLFETYHPDDKESGIGVEYKLHENESFKMKFRDSESFVGIEHKVKF